MLLILLPEASDVSIEAFLLPGASSSDLHLDVEEGTIKFTSQWLLSQLLIHLHKYINYKCIHKRFGTILFRKGGCPSKPIMGNGEHIKKFLYKWDTLDASISQC